MKTYEIISKDIQDKIEAGFYSEGEQLPSLREISRDYQSTPVTVKKSLKILEEKGYITTIDRRGSFVKTQENHWFTLIFHEFRSVDKLTDTKILQVEKGNPLEFYKIFRIDEISQLNCIKITRMLMQKRMPIGLDIKYLLLGSKVSLPLRNMKRLGESLSLVLNNYDILKDLEIKVLENNEMVREKLFLDPEDPVFCFEQIYRTINGQLVGAGVTYIPCNEIRIKIEN